MKKLKLTMILLIGTLFFLTGCQAFGQEEAKNKENQVLIGKWELSLINKGVAEEKSDGLMTFDENGKMFRTSKQETSGTKAYYQVKADRVYFADSKKALQEQVKQEGSLHYDLEWKNESQVVLWHADHDFGFLLKRVEEEDK